ncbi:cupin domain-containing protein [Agrobacterium sp. LAD9]|uniref:cupin domain-containing protein n=1 Tax=Agrobacterium sp. LAD9 TaxID=2055153 RepID=UPI000D1E7B94|nr:cupin domain-containing protein [Agrobacterium sp. LAD9]
MSVTVEKLFFKGNGRVPNSRLPLLIYRNVIQTSVPEMEKELRTNGWIASWHNAVGMFPKHHFHSEAHEFIAITRGSLEGLFGGHDGTRAILRTGDAVIIPAGVGHLGIAVSEDLRVSGGFPGGYGVLDFRLGRPDEYVQMCEAARQVPIPPLDPFLGAGGPLPDLWNKADIGLLAA